MNIAQQFVSNTLQSVEAVYKAVRHFVLRSEPAAPEVASDERQIICHPQVPAAKGLGSKIFQLIHGFLKRGGGGGGGGGVCVDQETAKEIVEAKPEIDDSNVSGLRNFCSPNWRDLISSSWNNEKYKRAVTAGFTQAIYYLESDRQENRKAENAIAPKWWTPFKYKLTQNLIDERDGSIFGAILEWDRSAALDDYVVMRPSGAWGAVVALRGTMLKWATIWRDIEDDALFVVCENLRYSVRFRVILEAVKSVSEKYGSSNVCIAGHSLGAAFALKVGQTLAKQGMYVETHSFHPPRSLPMIIRNVRQKAWFLMKRFESMLHSSSSTATHATNSDVKDEKTVVGFRLRNWIPSFSGNLRNSGVGLLQWMPHVYVNRGDYICWADVDLEEIEGNDNGEENLCRNSTEWRRVKLFVMSKSNQKFVDVHGLEQWYSDDMELQLEAPQLKWLPDPPRTRTPVDYLTQKKKISQVGVGLHRGGARMGLLCGGVGRFSLVAGAGHGGWGLTPRF